jgi:hypothetical protein
MPSSAGPGHDVTSLDEQASWLASVLDSRGFPLDRLAHNLRIAAEIVEAATGEPGGAVGGSLRSAAVIVAPPG